MGRAPCCDKANVKKGPWSPEEDAKLKDFIEKFGTGGNWIALPQKAGLRRCGKSCRLRWLNYLRPNIKHGDFSDEEDAVICTLYATIGSRWSIIAAQLPGRTDNDIKNYWNTKLKKKLMGLNTSSSKFSDINNIQSHEHLSTTMSKIHADDHHNYYNNSFYNFQSPKSLSPTFAPIDQPNFVPVPQNLNFVSPNFDDFSLPTPQNSDYFQYYPEKLNNNNQNDNMVIFGGNNETSCTSSSDGSCSQMSYVPKNYDHRRHHVKQEDHQMVGCNDYQYLGFPNYQNMLLNAGAFIDEKPNGVSPMNNGEFVSTNGSTLFFNDDVEKKTHEEKKVMYYYYY